MADQESLAIEPKRSESTLDAQMDAAEDPEFLRRLGFIKNLYQGDSVTEAIRREGKSSSTGYRWKKRWANGGIEALRPDTSSGRPPKLSESQLQAFRERVRAFQPCTTDQLETLLEDEFGVSFSRPYLLEYLPQHGFVYTTPAFQEATDADTLSDIEWDTNHHEETTARHPYDEQTSRPRARWTVLENS